MWYPPVHIHYRDPVPVHAVPVQMLVHYLFPVAVRASSYGGCSMGVLCVVDDLDHHLGIP